ncbi:MAG: glycosyltransferase family 2 protein [Candidatus Riflebacteria bacterium]|nr:glycosyltransferase family 2 protein [Candidatus Riflebacteria bacterium]
MLAKAPTLGISLIAHNEGAMIGEALASASFADRLVVVDCASTDDTAAIAASHPEVTVFSRPNNPNLNVNKSFGFDQLDTDWIFYLDPDERIPAATAAEIREVIAKDPEGIRHAAFRLPRVNHFFGHPLLHGGQYPDRQLRLFKRNKARFPNRHVHESLEVDGTVGLLEQPFDHHPYPTLSIYLRKMDFYATFQANFWMNAGIRPNSLSAFRYFVARPAGRFLRRFVLRCGFRDGWAGFIAAAGDAFQIMVSYAKLIEMADNRSSHP